METKKEYRYFSIFNHEGEQNYLRAMHNQGWKFIRVTGIGFYHFEECTPEDVIYQLDYNQEGIANKDEYVQMFNDSGWEYIQDFVGYSYFRKSASQTDGNEGIFCDDESRIQMMIRVLKGRLLPMLLLFVAALVPQLILNLFVYHNYYLAVMFGAVLLVYIAFFGAFAYKFYKYKEGIYK